MNMATETTQKVDKQMADFMNDLSATMEQALRKVMEQKLQEMMEEIQRGVLRFIDTEKQQMATHEIVEEAERTTKEFVGEFTIEENKAQEEPAVQSEAQVEVKQENRMAELTNFQIPRRNSGFIDWRGSDQQTQIQIIFYLMDYAERNNMVPDLYTGRDFKEIGGDFNGAYQQAVKLWRGPGAWRKAVTEYREYKESLLG